MRRSMFVFVSTAVFAAAVTGISAQVAPTPAPSRPAAMPPPTPAAPGLAPAAAAAAYEQAPTTPPPPGQDVPPPPAPPQRGGRGGMAQGVPGQAGGRGGRGGGQQPTPAAAMGTGRGGFAPYSGTMENIKVDVVLSDSITQSGGKKTVSMVVTNNRKGQIRSAANIGGYTLNVDAQPQLMSDGRILVALDLMYMPETTSEGRQNAMINESLSVLVKDGVAMLVSQSADPRSDRKVTVELTASTQK